ncbi:NAD(P)-dependent dehydrogenase (short-subunit alcohol dehydrogenase family) [Hymenobacter luteus]|uniref:NAD(P)-dependent dehydrogenase (Short-subunit alcohol dehydrogenase family) n=2 Tax=Hymenobacter TaxID=89966 RepID=A0A7W9T309_9BACT|nr:MULTISPECIES: SDR family oxidoreductase [Hymenobacter]MBB4602659.1 NAD(P)-dependent dehydrogenase (short-subunit alcohol dehydrogenase family) [Hymenobacter latericoloratus]MBB6060550.1 NAD(P)-dependent dehydrogenase (short-subunit alcohol dehydrogenase family) [Hymenobacter luteus]
MENKPTTLPPQAQDQQPGIEQEMTPQPEYIRPGYKGSEKLQGKVALITGGDSGIGRAVAVHFAREGADVAFTYLPEEEQDAYATRQLVEAEGRRCLTLSGDLRDPQFCQSIVDQTVQELGQLNILVNNAAEQFVNQNVADIADEQWLDTFQVNFFSFVRVTRAALAHLQEGDSIINTSSINAYRGNQQLVDYTSTKGAITAYTRSIAQQLAEKKIRVNSVAPGPIWTPLIPATFPPDKVAAFGKDTTMKRPGQPSEVAPAYVFLASEDASYITGQAIHPNGGEVLNT